MKNLRIILTVMIAAVLFTACNDDSEGVQPSEDIVQVALDNGFTSLAAALTKADLVDALQGSGPFTVFAPTNEAFDALLEAIGQNSIEDVPASVLTEVLLYHVVSAEVFSRDINDGDAGTLQGDNITLSTASGVTVNGVSVIQADVEASNGVIHVVDQVLVPAGVAQFVNTVLEPAYFNENFTTLISAAVKADVVGALLAADEITIFAPTNDAFAAAGIDVEATDAETLAQVLTYHVVGAKVLSSGIPANAGTLNGQNIFFSLTAGGNFINGNSEIVAVDIESGAGVVHVLDNVLLPPSGNIVEVAIELSADGEFTSLIAALQRTADEGTAAQNLLTVLSGDGPFTVFAPTNAAFEALLASNSSWNSLNDIPLATLVDVLTYHVVPARAFDKDLAAAVDANGQLSTALGSNISVDLNNLTINTNSNIIGVNTKATNGVIHVIDAVLLP